VKYTGTHCSQAIKEESARNRIKKRLNNYIYLKRERQQIAEERARLLARAEGSGVQNLDGMPRSQGRGDALAGSVAAAADLLTLYEAKAYELAKAQKDIERMIEGLEPVERMLARFRYIEGHTWEEVCVDMAYSWRQVHRIHGRILDKMVAAEIEKV
jgi:DNA-directed RNA polymerase specialized sigma24 family protein